jgi:hypothetical protein
MSRNIFQKLYHKDLEKAYTSFDGIVLDNLISEAQDIQLYLERLRKHNPHRKILLSYHNHFWEPLLILASVLGLRRKTRSQNWVDQKDVENLLMLSGYKVLSTEKRFFSLTNITTAMPNSNTLNKIKKYSVSIIVPARNEKGNIAKIIPSIPKFGIWQEIIFIEGNSLDNTWEKVKAEAEKRKRVIALKQTNTGKADAVQLGFSRAKGDILIIYDADRTVDARDLKKFYMVLATKQARFANGSRLVYPMEQDAMRTLNKIGNKLFGLLFSWILGTRFKDTLCGTKALFRKDYLKYINDYNAYLKKDPFGDFALIFTAIKNKLKVVEIPVRYKERVYGTTNIRRFSNGLQLLKMTAIAFLEFKT